MEKAEEVVKPEWCESSEALDGSFLGCWSLWSGIIKERKDCGECEFCSEVEEE